MKWLAPLLLTGCAAGPQLVQVPVPVRCVETAPVRPALVTDSDLKAMTDYQMALALRQFHIVGSGYIAELEAAVSGCTK